jgi:cytosine/adenosine deaminase-related metal-dependent hydrolase
LLHSYLVAKTTLGHAVWLSESDLDKLAATHTSVCHNCSSNFRLRSGVLPLNRLEARGINTAIGLDDVGINDDQDMLQEMRMVLRAHREPGMDDRVPTMAQVFRMATSGGAQTTPYATEIGTLEVGKAADMVLIDWKQISYPYLNDHHRVGLTPVQLGSPDMPLELWFATRLVTRDLDLYLDTLYSAFEMIASGITTVQHIHGWMPGKLADVEERSEAVIRAYEDIGMRVSYCFALRDPNHLVYEANEQFLNRVPADVRPMLAKHFDRFQLSGKDAIALFEHLHAKHHNKERVKIQLAPANLHWCSDEALTMLAECSDKYGVPFHMHLVETAEHRAGVAHNPISNLKLKSGVAPMHAAMQAGVQSRSWLRQLRLRRLPEHVSGDENVLPARRGDRPESNRRARRRRD